VKLVPSDPGAIELNTLGTVSLSSLASKWKVELRRKKTLGVFVPQREIAAQMRPIFRETIISGSRGQVW
jgi:hypothetical protein